MSRDFRVWRDDREVELEIAHIKRHRVSAVDERDAALRYADEYHARAGWEVEWPITFRVRDLYDEQCWDVVVERHTVPEFVAEKPVELGRLPIVDPDA